MAGSSRLDRDLPEGAVGRMGVCRQDAGLPILRPIGSALIDRRPSVFDTVVAYQPPSLPGPASELADYACTLDPYLMTKGSSIAQECLALDGRYEQPNKV